MIEQTAEKVSVRTPQGEYPIFLGSGLLDLRLLQMRDASTNCAIVTNSRVGALYMQRVADSLRSLGFQPHQVEIPDGERHKTLDTVRGIYDQLIDARLDRHSIIFALGGGVVGDVAGFAAATYLRGVPLVQLPTTLLAMVDSSIGGKTGVDHLRGKNLIGAFRQPLAVVADTETLTTLPEIEFRCGMAEVVKHAIIGDRGLFEELETGDWSSGVQHWLGRAIKVKVEIVERDPLEENERAKLNLGHTFGHAIERASGYETRHGEAVAIGIACASRLATRRKLCNSKLVADVEGLLTAIGLPTCVPRGLSADAILDVMGTDKKRVNERLRFVLPRDIGDVVVVDEVSRREVLDVLMGSEG
jgi:shikimate kinase / 3-dehydroquinate synthase